MFERDQDQMLCVRVYVCVCETDLICVFSSIILTPLSVPCFLRAKLKNNKEVCINPETKWLQQYLKNAINK